MVSNTIQFIFNNKIYKIKNPDSNQTVLNYIRDDLKKTGTKEGCAEGGCGACTIVCGELNKNKLIYKAINACISFLPTLNGKHLILVEDLIGEGNKLHPVQDAMVKFHGSQCGFCTPGFTMSLFSMYKNYSTINNEVVDEVLSGNLCRCTGYRPIIDAAKSLNKKKDQDKFKKNQSKIINLSKQMEEASEKLDFERASIFRDRIKSLNIIQSSQRINEANLVEADVIAAYKESGKTCIQVFFYRSKQNWGNQAYFPKHDPDQDISEIMSSFLMQFYENKNVPRLIILNLDIKDKKLIKKTLEFKEGKPVSIEVTKKGKKAKIILLAEKNAKEALTRKIYETENNKNLIENICNKFSLKTDINLIEVYDNSHISGTDSVGALISYGHDGFIKKRYRKFNIKTKGIKNDDYGMTNEVLIRRFSKAVKEVRGSLSLPDLVIIDGGKGQYSVARNALNECGLYDLPIIAIAKSKFRNSGNETFFHKNETYKFKHNDPSLFLLQRLRDEAHRFAISIHKAKRQKGIKKSLLDQINGIGSMRKRALLNYFGSARSVEAASLDEIKSVQGIEEKVATKIYDFFHE